MPRTHAAGVSRSAVPILLALLAAATPARAQQTPLPADTVRVDTAGPGTQVPVDTAGAPVPADTLPPQTPPLPRNTPGAQTLVPDTAGADTLGEAGPGEVTDLASVDTAGGGWGLVPVGGPAAERRRVLQLLGRAPLHGELLRSPSSLTPRLSTAGGAAAQVLAPEVFTVWNSGLAFSLNDGPMWAGRGANLSLSAGVRAAWGPVRLTLAPQLVYQQNRDTDVVPYPGRDRSRFAFPWPSHGQTDPYSIDLPTRFGDAAFWTVHPGQSTLAVSAGPLAVGASTEEQWWGPGVRNALVLSNHAPGVPHLFLRTERPLRTPLGRVEARWIAGALRESAYFDTIPGNDTRSLSALSVVLHPGWDPGLALGFARAVYRPVDGAGGAAARLFDAWLPGVGHPNDRDPFDTTTVAGPDQVISLFGRWVFPGPGLEVYAEWARRDLPDSFRDLLVYPHHGQGYTVGAQWARPLSGASAFRLQAEATYVEQSATLRQRPVAPWYTSRPVAQGYTHRGQVLGAAIGPGSSSQWAAADWMRPRWEAGVFAGRIRWHDDFHPNARRHPSNPIDVPSTILGHDVSVFAGVRGAVRLGGMQAWAEYTAATRYNVLFQYRSNTLDDIFAADAHNHTLRIGVSPASPW
jgi:hypothetical protein